MLVHVGATGYRSTEYPVGSFYCHRVSIRRCESYMSQSQSQLAQSQLELMKLETELALVQQELENALADLYAPLANLANSRLRQIQPLIRAAFVLIAATGDPDNESLRRQRLALAAGQEMLYLALMIHQSLLIGQEAAQDEQQKTRMGGIVLTGDYCFSRAAIFAAQTDHVQVVEIFSESLKATSEGMLRKLFVGQNGDSSNDQSGGTTSYDERIDLLSSCARSAACLVGYSDQTATHIHEIGRAIVDETTPSVDRSFVSLTNQIHSIPQLKPHQRARWAIMPLWLAKQTW